MFVLAAGLRNFAASLAPSGGLIYLISCFFLSCLLLCALKNMSIRLTQTWDDVDEKFQKLFKCVGHWRDEMFQI